MTGLSERERGLVRRALLKRLDGVDLTQAEDRALAKFEKLEAARLRARVVGAIPKGDWVAWSGRQVKVINEQARRYGFPFGGATIDLPAVVSFLHDFLARHWARFEQVVDGEALLSGGTTPALEEYRRHKAELARIEVERVRGRLLPREGVREGLLRVAGVYRRSGEILVSMFGPEAARVLDEMQRDALEEVERLFGDGAGGAAVGVDAPRASAQAPGKARAKKAAGKAKAKPKTKAKAKAKRRTT